MTSLVGTGETVPTSPSIAQSASVTSDTKQNALSFQVGAMLQVRDHGGDWRDARVLRLQGNDVVIECIGMPEVWKEGISAASDRIAPPGTHVTTCGTDDLKPERPFVYPPHTAQKPEQPGVVGLRNLGNTDAVNACLQCIFHMPFLVPFFLADKHLAELNTRNPLGWEGAIAYEVGALAKEYWSNLYNVLTIWKFKRVMSECQPRFSGYQQQDAQEVLSFLLDGLHEDLNRVSKKPPTRAVESKGREDALVAAESWQTYLLRNQSILVDHVTGQLKSRLECSKCARVSISFDPFLVLPLPIPTAGVDDSKSASAGSESLTLKQCILQFTTAESLGTDEQYCVPCKEFCPSTRKFDLWTPPDILILQLKRFTFMGGFRHKQNTFVDFPLADLDMLPFCANSDIKDASYSLFAVVNHYGGLGGGHHTAYIQNLADGNWYNYDDSHVSRVREHDIRSSSAYLLFYRRVPAKRTAGEPLPGGLQRKADSNSAAASSTSVSAASVDAGDAKATAQ